MENTNIYIWQTVAMYLTFVTALVASILAWRIGKKQNIINEHLLHVSDFAEAFVMPQQVITQDAPGNPVHIQNNLLVKNASSFPIYLNIFTLNGVDHLLGASAIPVGSDNWYAIPIPADVQQKTELSLRIRFEDHLRRVYESVHTGELRNGQWQIRSQRSNRIL